MDYFPVFHRLTGRKVLVVGAGEVAARKVALLLAAGAQVDLCARRIGHELEQRLSVDPVTWVSKQFNSIDSHYTLVIAATDDETLNRKVADSAKQVGIACNVVDAPAYSDFIVPSIVDRGAVTVAISTGGRAPVMARLLRQKLETLVPQQLDRLVGRAGQLRDYLKQKIPGLSERRHFWEWLFTREQALSWSQQELRNAVDRRASKQYEGEVYLVGAGPGDPELLTLKALRLMQQADVVVYDRLVSEEILDLVRRDAERIFVGKQCGNHHASQAQINDLLIDLAKQGKRVCRLKGGDPFVFGRGGEEATELFNNGVEFTIVPGITAATGCAASSGIPLTHRDYAHGVTLITGHLKDQQSLSNWAALAKPDHTLVFYMGLSKLDWISQGLLAQGLSQDYPAALIQSGTRENQIVITGTLSDLTAKCAQLDRKQPGLIVVGDVVKVRDELGMGADAAIYSEAA